MPDLGVNRKELFSVYFLLFVPLKETDCMIGKEFQTINAIPLT
jgi:hypothetical protein